MKLNRVAVKPFPYPISKIIYSTPLLGELIVGMEVGILDTLVVDRDETLLLLLLLLWLLWLLLLLLLACS